MLQLFSFVRIWVKIVECTQRNYDLIVSIPRCEDSASAVFTPRVSKGVRHHAALSLDTVQHRRSVLTVRQWSVSLCCVTVIEGRRFYYHCVMLKWATCSLREGAWGYEGERAEMSFPCIPFITQNASMDRTLFWGLCSSCLVLLWVSQPVIWTNEFPTDTSLRDFTFILIQMIFNTSWGFFFFFPL